MAGLAWLCSRLVLGAIGAFALVQDGKPIHWAAMWVQWDANYYLSILTQGYHEPPVVTGLESGQSNLNFFPLMPLGAWLVSHVVANPVLASLAFTNACLLVAAVGLHRVAMLRFGRDAADWAVLSLMLLPGSFMLSGVMTESLFLAISVWSFHLFAAGRTGPAALLGSLLSVTRLTGVVLAGSLAVQWLVRRVQGRAAGYGGLFLICLMPLPLFGFMGAMWWLTGDGLAFLHSQLAFWQHTVTYPFANFLLFATSDQPRLAVQSALALPLLLCLAASVRHLTAGEIVFAGLNVVSFASSDAASPSLLRYMLSLYPLHLAVGRWAAQGVVTRALLLAWAMANGALMTYWARGLDAVM